MSEANALLSRIDAEFAAVQERIKKFQAVGVQEFEQREKRLGLFSKLCEDLRDIWRPRLEALATKFGDRVKVAPTLTPTKRFVVFSFLSELADIKLTFTVTTDADVQKLVLDYDLHILPILMRFTPHAQIDFPLLSVDRAAVGQWIDDRIVDFVRTYLSLHENEHYLKDHMVQDPIAGVRFPKFAAAATLDWQGKTYYFIGEETRRTFATQHNIPATP